MLQFSAVTLLHLQLVDCAPRISFQVLISSPFLSFLSVLSRLLHTDTYTGLLIRPPDDRPPRPHPQCSALATHSEYRCNSRTDRPSPTTVSAAREEPWKRRRKDALSLPLGSLSLSLSPSRLALPLFFRSSLFLPLLFFWRMGDSHHSMPFLHLCVGLAGLQAVCFIN